MGRRRDCFWCQNLGSFPELGKPRVVAVAPNMAPKIFKNRLTDDKTHKKVRYV